jgi:ABC-type branched-subunit amino acid transport system permease subunit
MSSLKRLLLPKRIPFVFWVTLIIFLFVIPQFSGKYTIYMVMSILIFSLLCLSVNLLLGYTGLLSFGQATSVSDTPRFTLP